MIRAVLDSNVIVSSVIRQEGAPGQLLRAALEAGKFTLVTSPFLLREGIRIVTPAQFLRALAEEQR